MGFILTFSCFITVTLSYRHVSYFDHINVFCILKQITHVNELKSVSWAVNGMNTHLYKKLHPPKMLLFYSVNRTEIAAFVCKVPRPNT